MPHPNEKYMALRYKQGTPEYLWRKWFTKLWNAYPMFSQDPRGEPPSYMRNEFIKDVNMVVEREIARLFPEKTVLKNK